MVHIEPKEIPGSNRMTIEARTELEASLQRQSPVSLGADFLGAGTGLPHPIQGPADTLFGGVQFTGLWRLEDSRPFKRELEGYFFFSKRGVGSVAVIVGVGFLSI